MEKNIGRSRESRNYKTRVSRSYEDTEVETYTMERRKSLFTMCEKYKPEIHPLIVDHLEDQRIPASGKEKTGDRASNRVTGLKDSMNAA